MQDDTTMPNSIDPLGQCEPTKLKLFLPRVLLYVFYYSLDRVWVS